MRSVGQRWLMYSLVFTNVVNVGFGCIGKNGDDVNEFNW